jgi:hypothetical protein
VTLALVLLFLMGQLEPVEPFKGAFSAPKKGLKDEVIVRRLRLSTSA